MASNAKNLAELLNTDSTVAVGDIADGSVSTAKLADDAVTSAKLGASAVDATALASNAVTTAKIANNAVATAKVADGAVTQAKTTGVGKGKNLIINGNFQVFQRGAGARTASDSSYAKTDRFKYFISGVTTTQDQQQFTHGQTDVPGEPEYYMRNILASNSSASDYSIVAQHIEDVKTCAGQEVTLSFYAKSSVNGNKVAVEFNQSFGTGGSSRVTSAQTGDTASLVTLTTSWAKYTVTTTIDSISGKTLGPSNTSYLELYLWMSGGSNYNGRSNSLGNQSGNFDFANIQLEVGSAATDFEDETFEETQRKCQRYYVRAGGANYASIFGAAGWANTTSSWIGKGKLPVPMRASFTMTVTGSPRIQNGQSGYTASNFSGGLSIDNSTKVSQAYFTFACNASGLTLYRAHDMDASNGAAVVELDAEL